MAEPFVPRVARHSPRLSSGVSKMAKAPTSSVLVALGDRQPQRAALEELRRVGPCLSPCPFKSCGEHLLMGGPFRALESQLSVATKCGEIDHQGICWACPVCVLLTCGTEH